MAKPAQALIGERPGINSFHGRARATLRASWAFLWLAQDRKPESSMTARWICAALTAAFLAVIVLASGSHGSRAAATETAIFAGGCFWCVEAAFDEVDGVTETISGYAGGTKPNPNYGSHEGYQEAVKVTYDPAKVTYATLLDHFWRNIDPFDPDGQFCDQGNAYRSVVFVANNEGKQLAEKTKEEIAARYKQKAATAIKPVTTFTAAEAYHQDYHNQNPVSYKYYKWGCGRAQRLPQNWGQPSGSTRPKPRRVLFLCRGVT